MVSNLKYRDLVLIIIWEKKRICSLLKDNETFTQLLDYLSDFDIDSYDPLPSQKEVLSSLGLKRPALIAQLRSIVSEFYKSVESGYPINDYEITFVITDFADNHFNITLENTRYIPRVGEKISFPFLRTEYGSVTYLDVTKVHHEIEDQKHIINVFAEHS